MRGGYPGQPDLTTGLVAYWSFDNCDATDDSGNGHNGTIYGNPQCVDGEKGKAFSFDGQDDYITVPDSSSLQISTNEITVSARIRLNDNVGVTQWRIAEKQQTREIAWGLEVFGNEYWGATGNNINFHDSNGATWVNCLANEVNLNARTWYHVVATDSNGIIKIYVDGNLAHECTNGLGIPALIVSPIEVARNLMENNFFFNGILDEVRIYNRALTEAEIQALYSGELIIVDSGVEWRYSDKEQPGWTEISFDDSQWNTGITPFDDHSVTGWCDFGGNGTNWPLYTSLYLRKNIDVKQQGDLTLRIAIDNDFFLYFDGNEVAAINSEGCPYKWQYEYNIPSVNAGTHTIAVKIMDRGDDNGFDLMVSHGEGRLSNLEVFPSSSYFDFGEVWVGDSRLQPLTLENKGNADLNITGISLSDNENFSLDINGGTNPCAAANRSLSPKTSCTIAVSFRPSEGRVFDTNLTIASNDPDSPMSIAINGKGLKSSLDVNVSDFGSVDKDEHSEQDVTIRNTGNTAVNITDIALTNVENFSLPDSAYSCRTTLNPGDTCSFEISFHPKSDGILIAALAISSNLHNATYIEYEVSGRGLISVDHDTKLYEDVTLFGHFVECGNDITNEDRVPLILVHGVHGSKNVSGSDAAEYWSEFGKKFCSKRDLKNKYKIYLFSYTSDKHPVREIGQSLRNTLDDFIRQGKIRDSELVILSHSMGGLVARSYMQEHSHTFGNYENRRGWERTTLITLATPHHGSPGQNDTGALESYFTTGWHVVFSSSQLFYNLTSATPGSKWNVTINSAQPNRDDLRWDSMFYPDLHSDTNDWLKELNEGLTPEMANKIIAYYGYIDPQRTDRKRYEALPYLKKIIKPSVKCFLYLPEVACYNDHQKLTVASAIMNAGLKRAFPKNDGMVPVQSGELEGKTLRKVIECFDHDHLDMLLKLSDKNKKCSNGKSLFQYVKDDLFGL
jgi:pimeloyl-ACP methyl ester carboxylesterase